MAKTKFDQLVSVIALLACIKKRRERKSEVKKVGEEHQSVK